MIRVSSALSSLSSTVARRRSKISCTSASKSWPVVSVAGSLPTDASAAARAIAGQPRPTRSATASRGRQLSAARSFSALQAPVRPKR